jgi:NTE family protein
VSGKRESTYDDRSQSVAVGLGITPVKSLAMEAEYCIEYMNVSPNVAFRGNLAQYPEFYDILRSIRLTLDVDMLDDVLLPRTGMLLQAALERNYKELGSDLNFWCLQGSGSVYHTVGRRHTFHLGGTYGLSSGNSVPVYKYFFFGGIGSFIGADYDQLIATQLGIVRVEYRYEYKKDIFLKLLANTVFDHHIGTYALATGGRLFWGYGAGIQFQSIFGPIEIVYGRGEATIFNPGKKANYLYFSAGYKF